MDFAQSGIVTKLSSRHLTQIIRVLDDKPMKNAGTVKF